MSLSKNLKYSEGFGGLSLRRLGLVTKPGEQDRGCASRTMGTRCLGAVGTFLSFLVYSFSQLTGFLHRELMVPEFHILYFRPPRKGLSVSDSVIKIHGGILTGLTWVIRSIGWAVIKRWQLLPVGVGKNSSQKKGEGLYRQYPASACPHNRAGLFISVLWGTLCVFWWICSFLDRVFIAFVIF